MRASLLVMVVHDESFRNFFPAGVVRTGAGFWGRPGGYWVESRHRVPEFRDWIPRLNRPGIRMTVFKKNASRSEIALRLSISAADKFGALLFIDP
jgi:hypothetical protein